MDSNIGECPVWTQQDKNQINGLDYWLNGVMTIIFGGIGIATNTAVMSKLQSKLKKDLTMKCLILGLGLVQNLYLTSMTIDTFRKVNFTAKICPEIFQILNVL